MPPKKAQPDKPSKKTENKKKEKVIEVVFVSGCTLRIFLECPLLSTPALRSAFHSALQHQIFSGVHSSPPHKLLELIPLHNAL